MCIRDSSYTLQYIFDRGVHLRNGPAQGLRVRVCLPRIIGGEPWHILRLSYVYILSFVLVLHNGSLHKGVAQRKFNLTKLFKNIAQYDTRR